MHESEATRKPTQSARRLVRQAKNLPGLLFRGRLAKLENRS